MTLIMPDMSIKIIMYFIVIKRKNKTYINEVEMKEAYNCVVK